MLDTGNHPIQAPATLKITSDRSRHSRHSRHSRSCRSCSCCLRGTFPSPQLLISIIHVQQRRSLCHYPAGNRSSSSSRLFRRCRH